MIDVVTTALKGLSKSAAGALVFHSFIYSSSEIVVGYILTFIVNAVVIKSLVPRDIRLLKSSNDSECVPTPFWHIIYKWFVWGPRVIGLPRHILGRSIVPFQEQFAPHVFILFKRCYFLLQPAVVQVPPGPERRHLGTSMECWLCARLVDTRASTLAGVKGMYTKVIFMYT